MFIITVKSALEIDVCGQQSQAASSGSEWITPFEHNGDNTCASRGVVKMTYPGVTSIMILMTLSQPTDFIAFHLADSALADGFGKYE